MRNQAFAQALRDQPATWEEKTIYLTTVHVAEMLARRKGVTNAA